MHEPTSSGSPKHSRMHTTCIACTCNMKHVCTRARQQQTYTSTCAAHVVPNPRSHAKTTNGTAPTTIFPVGALLATAVPPALSAARGAPRAAPRAAAAVAGAAAATTALADAMVAVAIEVDQWEVRLARSTDSTRSLAVERHQQQTSGSGSNGSGYGGSGCGNHGNCDNSSSNALSSNH